MTTTCTTESWYTIENAEEIASPALVIYPDRVAENLRRIIAIAGGTERLRPHVKTHKLPQIVKMQIDAGIRKFKCATIAESEMVAGAGRDVLLAYPLVGPTVRRFFELQRAFPSTHFSALTDNAAAAKAISAAAEKAGAKCELLIDIDNGMHRTGIAPGAACEELYHRLADLPGLSPGGLHIYDGHIRHADIAERTKAAEDAFAPVLTMVDRLKKDKLPVPRLVAGGTPTFPIHAKHADRETSPGTCVLWDHSYATKFPDLQFVNAALVLTRVISKPTPDRLCLDLGYKAIASDNPDPRVKLIGIDDAKTVNHSEEHLVVETSVAGKYEVGDIVYGVPFHVCPTCALHRQAVIVEEHAAGNRWDIVARDRMLSV